MGGGYPGRLLREVEVVAASTAEPSASAVLGEGVRTLAVVCSVCIITDGSMQSELLAEVPEVPVRTDSQVGAKRRWWESSRDVLSLAEVRCPSSPFARTG